MSDVSLSWFAHRTVFPTYSKYMEIRFIYFFKWLWIVHICEQLLSDFMSCPKCTLYLPMIHGTHDARTWCTTSKPQSGPNSPGISTSVCSTFFLINIGGFQQVPSSLSVACLSLACLVCLFGIDNNLSWTTSNVLIHVLYILNWYHTF